VVRNVAGPWSSSRPRGGGRQNVTQRGDGRRVPSPAVGQSVEPKTVTRTSAAPEPSAGRVRRADDDEHEHDAHQGDFDNHPAGWGAAR